MSVTHRPTGLSVPRPPAEVGRTPPMSSAAGDQVRRLLGLTRVPSVGQLIASGRDSDIFEYGPDLVLRRSRDGRSMAVEARTMEYVRSRGYPVPAIDEVVEDGAALVMERIHGASMIDVLKRKPWSMRAQAKVLAQLHQRLHDIEAPDWIRAAPGTEGDALVHLDLHPLNVMIAGRGPVVIDWPNAARGQPATDVAITWVLLHSGSIPASGPLNAVLGRLRSTFVRAFIANFDLDPVRRQLQAVVDYKIRDPHMSTFECQAMRQLAESAALP